MNFGGNTIQPLMVGAQETSQFNSVQRIPSLCQHYSRLLDCVHEQSRPRPLFLWGLHLGGERGDRHGTASTIKVN